MRRLVDSEFSGSGNEKQQFLAAVEQLGHYRLIEKIGDGGESSVWKAEDERMGRTVAIKVLDQRLTIDAAKNELQRKKFESEWRNHARLSHHNIVTIYDFGVQDSYQYIVMELVEGQALNRRLANGPIPLTEACDIIEQLASALDLTHSKNIVHRDIKPSNIVLVPSTGPSRSDWIKLIDFGISRHVDDPRLTMTGNFHGTPSYASPERMRGEIATIHSDVWAVGVLLYEMLSGKKPFQAPDPQGVRNLILFADVPLLDGDAMIANPVVGKALAKDPSLRYASAGEMATELSNVVSQRQAAGSITPRDNTPVRPVGFGLLTWDQRSSPSSPAVPAPSTVAAATTPLSVRHRALARADDPATTPPPATTPSSIAEPIRINPKDGAEMVYIPAGEFLMGDSDQTDNPRHAVKLSGYYIYKNLVTVAMYRRFCDAAGKQMPHPPRWGLKDNHPIVNVSWDDAKAYCDWAGARLPSEAEWEKAARGTDGRKYPWGDGLDTNKLWCSHLSVGDAGGTHSVGCFPAGASPYGVLDMAGNVYQWCADWYDEAFWDGRHASETNPVNNVATNFRVLRGGSWYEKGPWFFHAARRDWHAPSKRGNLYGFRAVVAAGPHAAVPLSDIAAVEVSPLTDSVSLTLEQISKTSSVPPASRNEVQRLRPAETKPEHKPNPLVPKPPSTDAMTAGMVKINPRDGAEMLYVPTGPFQMGDDNMGDGKDNRMNDNKSHSVTLSGYYIYKNLVTVSMYRRFCDAAGKQMPDPPHWGWKDGHPIVNVSWDDANAYCKWAGGRLPTEAEWEKAARGTDGRKYPWGDGLDTSKLWCSHWKRGDAGQTHSVGGFTAGASPYGVLDMAGNVYQWCADWYDRDFWDGNHASETNPVNDVASNFRVLRGGSWLNHFGLPYIFRTAFRYRNRPSEWSDNAGFRAVVAAGPP